MKAYINGQGQMTKMATIAINSKNLQKSSSLEQKAHDFETWHEAQGIEVLKVYINDNPGMTLTYFMARST